MPDSNPYESARMLGEYLLFHYGAPDEILPYPFGPIDALGFPERCVSLGVRPEGLPSAARALDVGCAVGRASFELARTCGEVLGIDRSRQFIAAACRLCEDGVVSYDRVDEGLLTTRLQAHVPTDIDRSRVQFRASDAQSLPQDLGQFDVVLAANLIDRLPDPRRFLDRLPGLVRQGGQLILTSPYTWLPDFTPIGAWLGGFVHAGHPVKTLQALDQALAPAFRRTATLDLPFLIREHSRKFQWSVAQLTRWARA
jgi:putative 4-mercaptohistidine N1-methyltranferase